MPTFEVWSTVEGALEGSASYPDEESAETAALELAQDLGTNLPDAAWSVYILPHYCDETDPESECTCAQWLQDHHPRHSSVPA